MTNESKRNDAGHDPIVAYKLPPYLKGRDRATLVFNDDRTAIEEVCMGPDEHGKCPWAERGVPAACAGKWIMNRGWDFKVALDAESCPLISLGLSHIARTGG